MAKQELYLEDTDIDLKVDYEGDVEIKQFDKHLFFIKNSDLPALISFLQSVKVEDERNKNE